MSFDTQGEFPYTPSYVFGTLFFVFCFLGLITYSIGMCIII